MGNEKVLNKEKIKERNNLTRICIVEAANIQLSVNLEPFSTKPMVLQTVLNVKASQIYG